jgi:glycosyltransferase involved in cell wall biosynthesis
MRAQARRNTGMWDGTLHLASFGYIDTRTKLTDTVVESAAWLQQWGHKVHLHLVGSALPGLEAELTDRAQAAGLTGFTITGYVPESTFRDYLLGTDLGIQLRVSPLLGVSGPLSDMAAYGTPAIASSGLAIDVDTPAFINRLPDDVSPVMVAEAIEAALAQPRSLEEREAMRREYLEEKSPQRYADHLLRLLADPAKVPAT